MNKKIRNWFITGTIFTIFVGTLLHFVYEWSGNSLLASIFTPVNESVWEHLKLLFWTTFIYSIFEYLFIGKEYNNYITAKAVSIYLGILLIILLFYAYTAIVGKSIVFIDILIFIISIVISQYVGYKITISDYYISDILNFISLIAVALLADAFIIFTFNTPHLPIFKDPITGGYGIKGA